MGYGAAALTLAPKYRVRAKDAEGKATAGQTINITVEWDIPRARPLA